MSEWFERWFGEAYLEMYPHRDEKDAAAAVDLIASNVPLEDRLVLDLGCGPGRHAELLNRRAASVVGLDLSMPLLRRARDTLSRTVSLARGDMRTLPFASGAFHMAVNLFTSFGYFDSDEQHTSVLEEVARVLTTGGIFVLDFLNASHVKETLVSDEVRFLGEKKVSIRRWISEDGRFVFKEMSVLATGDRFLERVRLFAPQELESMLADAGMVVRARYGSYAGGSLGKDGARVVLFSERT